MVEGFPEFVGTLYNWYGNIVEPCSCCGARLRKTDSKVSFKGSNFINIKAGGTEEYTSADGKREVKVIQTKNGPITVGMRYEW